MLEIVIFENFSVRVVLETYLLYRELPLPSSCCKGEACLPRSHYRGKPRVQNCVSRSMCGLRKTKKIFLANYKQGSLNRGKKWFSENLRKNFDLENFRSESFSRRTSCIGSSRFRARVAEGRPASRDHITGGNLESRIVYRGVGADFEKPKKYFRLIMNRVA